MYNINGDKHNTLEFFGKIVFIDLQFKVTDSKCLGHIAAGVRALSCRGAHTQPQGCAHSAAGVLTLNCRGAHTQLRTLLGLYALSFRVSSYYYDPKHKDIYFMLAIF